MGKSPSRNFTSRTGSEIMLTNDKVPLIREKALWMRRTAFTMVHRAQLGHPGGDFSAMDILATLYFGVLNYDPKRPNWEGRDRFVMSKGHATGALYSALCAEDFEGNDLAEWSATAP